MGVGVGSTARWRGILRPVLCAGAWALAVPAAAQVSPGQPPLPGSAPAAPDGLALNASGEVLYDSNLLRTSAPVVAAGLHKDDIRYTPEASGTYGRNTGLIALAVNGLIGRDIFQNNRYLDRNRYLGGGSLTYHSGTSCQLVVNGTYSSRQAGIRGDGAEVIDPGTPADDVGAVIDNVLTTATYGANAGCGSPTGRLSFGGGYVHSSLNNGSPSRKFGDSDADTYSGNIGIGILQPGQLSLNGSYTTIAYPDRAAFAMIDGIPAGAISTGVKTYRIGLSFSRPIGSKLSGTVGLSYLHSDPIGGQGAYSSPAYTLAVSYIASQRLSFTLTGSRDIVPSTTAGALFRVADQLLLTATYSLGSAITVNANAGLIGNEYKGGFAVNNEPLRRNDTTTNFGVGVTYAPRSLYDVTLNVTQSNRTSDPGIYDYASTRVSVMVAVHF